MLPLIEIVSKDAGMTAKILQLANSAFMGARYNISNTTQAVTLNDNTVQISGEGQRRIKEINRGLPYVIDLMALGMSAGLDFPGAVRQGVEKSSNPEDPLIEEMTRVLQELSLGRTRKQTLTDFAAGPGHAGISAVYVHGGGGASLVPLP